MDRRGTAHQVYLPSAPASLSSMSIRWRRWRSSGLNILKRERPVRSKETPLRIQMNQKRHKVRSLYRRAIQIFQSIWSSMLWARFQASETPKSSARCLTRCSYRPFKLIARRRKRGHLGVQHKTHDRQRVAQVRARELLPANAMRQSKDSYNRSSSSHYQLQSEAHSNSEQR